MSDVSGVVFIFFPPIRWWWMNVQVRVMTEAMALHPHCVRDKIPLPVFESGKDTAAHTHDEC